MPDLFFITAIIFLATFFLFHRIASFEFLMGSVGVVGAFVGIFLSAIFVLGSGMKFW